MMVDIDEIYNTCLAAREGHAITGTTVLNFAKDPFKIWCDRNAPEDARDPPSEYLELLMEQGNQHEEKTVAEAYPEAEEVEYTTREEGLRIALESMRDGVVAMHNAPIFHLPEGMMGIADILERIDTQPSVFGEYHYIIKEIKLAKNIRNHHRLQAAFYNRILGKIQRYTPDYYILVNRDREETLFNYDEAELLEVLNDIREIFDGREVSPTYGSCDWPWETYCNQEAIRRRDISVTPGVGPSRKEKLSTAGITSVSDLATTKTSDLAGIRGIGDRTASRLIDNATAIVKGAHIKLGDVVFPAVSTEIFLDLEGTGEQVGEEELVAIDYLIGVLVRHGGEERYIPFLARTLDGESKMFQDFLEWLARQHDYVIYHWHYYEKTHLRRLAERHGMPDHMHGRLFGRLRDLYKDAVSCFAFPTYGQGLKPIASYMGFSWRHEDVDAMTSMAYFFQYLQDPEDNRHKLKKVVDYNEDDCIATRVVKDWIELENRGNTASEPG